MFSRQYTATAFLIFLSLCGFFWLLSPTAGPLPSRQLPEMGVTHIVLFQFKPGVTAESIKDVCARMLALKDNCIHPTSQKPYIKSSMGGTDNSLEGIQNGITHAFIVQFESAEDRDYYVQKDPAHRAFVQSLGEILEKAQVVDFTGGVFE